MTETEKNKISKLADKAADLFLKHGNACQELEKELDKYSKVEILEILYQTSDGLVVAIEHDGWESDVPDNIPIKQFLKEYVK